MKRRTSELRTTRLGAVVADVVPCHELEVVLVEHDLVASGVAKVSKGRFTQEAF